MSDYSTNLTEIARLTEINVNLCAAIERDSGEIRTLRKQLAAVAASLNERILHWHDAQGRAEAAEERVRQLVTALDAQHGTPCEQIRHQQEVEALEERVRVLEKALAPVIAALPEVTPLTRRTEGDGMKLMLSLSVAEIDSLAAIGDRP